MGAERRGGRGIVPSLRLAYRSPRCTGQFERGKAYMAMGRVMELVTEPKRDDLLFHRLHARDDVSRLSEFELDLLSLKRDINLDDVLGKSFTVKLELPDKK